METANHVVLKWQDFWRNHLAQWQSSGLTQVAYCRQQSLLESRPVWLLEKVVTVRSVSGRSPRLYRLADDIGRHNAGGGAE